jgi:hypothetical protein
MTLDDLEAKLLLAQERMRQVEAGPYSENNEKEYWAASYALLEIEQVEKPMPRGLISQSHGIQAHPHLILSKMTTGLI